MNFIAFSHFEIVLAIRKVILLTCLLELQIREDLRSGWPTITTIFVSRSFSLTV